VIITVVKETREECCCVTGAEIGDISKNDNLLGKRAIVPLLPAY
jgi:hypothetical protein